MMERGHFDVPSRGNGRAPGRAPVPPLVRGLAILLLAAAGVGPGAGCIASAPTEGEQNTIQSTLHLDTFVINLADVDQRSYLRVGIDLGLNRELKRDAAPPIAAVRDAVLGVLAQYKADDLMTAAGKTNLKEALLHALQQRVPQLGVREIYFTEFLIQR
jgi:flagellar protein FliL